jgi:hypothetical protein
MSSRETYSASIPWTRVELVRMRAEGETYLISHDGCHDLARESFAETDDVVFRSG